MGYTAPQDNHVEICECASRVLCVQLCRKKNEYNNAKKRFNIQYKRNTHSRILKRPSPAYSQTESASCTSSMSMSLHPRSTAVTQYKIGFQFKTWSSDLPTGPLPTEDHQVPAFSTAQLLGCSVPYGPSRFPSAESYQQPCSIHRRGTTNRQPLLALWNPRTLAPRCCHVADANYAVTRHSVGAAARRAAGRGPAAPGPGARVWGARASANDATSGRFK